MLKRVGHAKSDDFITKKLASIREYRTLEDNSLKTCYQCLNTGGELKIYNHTSAFRASSTDPGTGSGQNSSGVKLQSIRLINGRLIDGHT